MDSQARQHLTHLMSQLADGDRAAFDGVYSALWPAVSAFCAKMLPSADAEDTAQMALLKVFEQASSFDRDKDVLAWALAIATWEVRTMRQRHARSKAIPSDDIEAEFSGKNPEGLLLDREIVEAAQSAIGMLSDVDQATLLATFSGESSEPTKGATVRKRRQRAIYRLKEAWRSIYGD